MQKLFQMMGEIFRIIIGAVLVIALVVLCFGIGIWQNSKSLEERGSIRTDQSVPTYRNL